MPLDVVGRVGIVLMNDNMPSSVVTSMTYVAVVVCIKPEIASAQLLLQTDQSQRSLQQN